MSTGDAQLASLSLIEELRARFPLLNQLVGRFGPIAVEERPPWFFGFLLAAASNPNPGSCCIVLDKTQGTTAIAAVLLSLVKLQHEFGTLVSEYAKNILVSGQRVKVNPSGFVYEYEGVWPWDGPEDGPEQFGLKVMGDRSRRSFPVDDVLRIEPTDRLRPKGQVNSTLGEFELSKLDRLLHLTAGGNHSLIKNRVLVQMGQRQFSEIMNIVRLSIQGAGQPDPVADLLPWGGVASDGQLRSNDGYQVEGEPLVAATRVPEDLARVCNKSPESTKVVLIDGASRIVDHPQAFDDISDRQRLVVLASPEEYEAVNLLRSRGSQVWNMSASEVLIGEESPGIRTRESLAGGSIRAADVRRRSRVSTVDCEDESLQAVADRLEQVAAMAASNSDGDSPELEIVARLFGIAFECSECCFGVGEEVKDRLWSVHAQIRAEQVWMRPEVTSCLVEAVELFEKVVANRHASQKAEALLSILSQHVNGIRRERWAIVARTQRTADHLSLGLRAREFDVPVLNVQTIPPDREYDGIIVTAWPNSRRFSRLRGLAITADLRVLTYPFERGWVYNHQRNEKNLEKSDRIDTSVLATMLDMEEELLSSFRPIEGDTLDSRSDSDSPIIEIEERLSRPRVRRPVSPIITADTREVRLIQFAGGCYSLLTEWSELPVLNALVDSAPGDTAELNYSPAWRLAVGDLVLFRAGGDKGFIRLLAEEHLGTVQYENVRELAESWKPALRSLGRNLDEVQRQLVKVGLHRTDPTVSAWLNNPDRIGPGQADDIEYIARAAGNEELLSNLTNVAEAISQIRGSHIVAGRSLTQLILEGFQGRASHVGGQPLRIDLDYGQAWVVQVEAVDRDVSLYPTNQVNRLLWDIDSEF